VPGLCLGGGSLLVWDWQEGGGPQQLCCVEPRETGESFYSLAFSPDGRRFVAGMLNGKIRLWRVDGATFTLERDFGNHFYSVRSLHFSSDSRLLISGSDDGTVRLWRVDALREPPIVLTVLSSQGASVRSMALSPDERSIAVAGSDSSVRLWSLDIDMLSDMVCERVWWNVSGEEWARYVNADIPREETCPGLPVHDVS
jgi:WD40 repeat protein